MNISVNEKILVNLFDDKKFVSELKSFLNSIINEEIKKCDDMDTELIDECVNVLLDLESENSLTPSNNIIRFCHKKTNSNYIRFRNAAAVIAVALISLSAVTAANPAFAKEARELFSTIAQSLGIAADETNNGDTEIETLYAKLDKSDLTVKSKADIDFSNIKVYAIYKNNIEKEIPINDCKVTYKDIDKDKILAIVSYKGTAFSLVYTIKE